MIPFSLAAADELVQAADSAASRLRGQGSIREASVAYALETFSGGYARGFKNVCAAEAESRGKLAGVLEDLIPQVEEAKWRYEEEKTRQDNLSAWWQREETRQQQRALVSATGTFVEPWDPKPPVTPIVPNPIHAAFACSERARTASGGGGSGEVSADPIRLRNFVQESRTQDRLLQEESSRLRSAWSGFTGACSWVPVDSGTFITGFEQHVEANQADATWIEGIADEFASMRGQTLNWLDDKFSITPHDGMSSPWAWGTWGLGHTVTGLGMVQQIREQQLTRSAPRVGWLPKWMSTSGKKFPSTQKFISRATDFHAWNAQNPGQFAPKSASPSSMRGKFFMNLGQNRVPKAFKADAVSRWGKVGKVLGPLGATLTGGVAGYEQWQQDSSDPNMRTAEKIGRTATVGLSVGGGAMGGAALGATIGSAIPGVGTVIGGVVGGVIGGVAGSSIGQKIGDVAKGLGGELTQKAADTARDVGKGISDGAKAVGEFFGGVFK